MARSAASATLVVVLIMLSAPPLAHPQPAPEDNAGERIDTLVASAAPLRVGSFVVPRSESLLLNDAILDSSDYSIDYRYGLIEIAGGGLAAGDTLFVRYRRFPFAFKDVYRRYEPQADEAGSFLPNADPAVDLAGRSDPFGNVRLQRSGSITRGIITGNNRDVSVESGLRMQLSGEVAEGVQVNAVLTDENTPIQPEGVTRRLNEFDRVSISIEHEAGRAELGDFTLAFDGTRFGRFDRKLQGVSISGDLPAAEGSVFGGGRVTVAGATSRGIFQSHEIEPIDGVQGPYRLRGREGERFIIVIAGSEIVHLDGKQLTRGETNDYVIDYQTGEISFTPKRLVTEDRRIQVEFQYTTVEFTRTVVGSRADVGWWQRPDGSSRVNLGTTFLREADGRDFGAELGLTTSDSLAIVESGDALAFRSGAERVAFDPEAPFVQYAVERRQHEAGAPDSIFVALHTRPEAGEAVYRVRFAHVGEGEGSYARIGRAVNGLQYEYVGPGQGAYDPIRILPRPRQQRLVGFHGSAELIPRVHLFGEWAGSLNDQNRLSGLDSGDDAGSAFLAGLRLQPTAIRLAGIPLGDVSGSFERQQTAAHFAAFGRTRPVEFARRWNLLSRRVDPLQGVIGGGGERVDEARLAYAPSENSSFGLQVGNLDLGGTFQASHRSVTLSSTEMRLPHVDYRLEHVASSDSLLGEQGEWLRQLAVVRDPLLGGRLTPSVEIEHERRLQQPVGTDSLARGSLEFIEYRPGLVWSAERMSVGAEIEMRDEKDWLQGSLRNAARSWTWTSSMSLRPGGNFTSDASLGYRVRRFEESFREAGRGNTESVVLRWNGRHTPLERAIETDWLYEALTERTPTMQEMYIQTTADYPEASYVWEDANGDGLVQVDEFLPELTPNEGTYVRTFVPSDSLMSVVSVQARLRLNLDPARLLSKPATGLQRALAQVSSRTTVDVQEKSRETDLERIYLLEPASLLQPGLTLNGRVRLQQEIFLFRRNTRYGLDATYSRLHGLNELASGRESRFLNNWRIEGRYRFSDGISTRLSAQLDQNRLTSEAFSSRRYDLHSITLEPELIFAASRAFEARVGSVLSRKADRFFDRRARLIRFPLELRYMQARRLQVTGRVEFANTRVTGDAVGLARYELTDGRGVGTSFLWHLTAQYRLNEYLRASLAYDGRAPEGAPTLHTLRLQMSAIF